MSDINLMRSWLAQLDDIIDEQDLVHDQSIQRQRNLIEIEVSGVEINLPNLSDATTAQLQQIHKANIVTMMLDTLQSALGYYHLPLITPGSNEPPVAPAIASELKEKLLHHEVDLYIAKSILSDALKKEVENK